MPTASLPCLPKSSSNSGHSAHDGLIQWHGRDSRHFHSSAIVPAKSWMRRWIPTDIPDDGPIPGRLREARARASSQPLPPPFPGTNCFGDHPIAPPRGRVRQIGVESPGGSTDLAGRTMSMGTSNVPRRRPAHRRRGAMAARWPDRLASAMRGLEARPGPRAREEATRPARIAPAAAAVLS